MPPGELAVGRGEEEEEDGAVPEDDDGPGVAYEDRLAAPLEAPDAVGVVGDDVGAIVGAVREGAVEPGNPAVVRDRSRDAVDYAVGATGIVARAGPCGVDL